MNPKDYSFHALLTGGINNDDPTTSLCYLVSLVDSANHKISEALPAKRILSWLYGFEEQALDVEDLEAAEQFFSRYFSGGFYPQTPCMVVRNWSPISAMLERGFEPRVLNREGKFRAVATGIWDPRPLSHKALESAKTDEALFWTIMRQVTDLCVSRRMLISIIAQPGWDYDSAIDSLPSWADTEVEKTGRVIWKRTSQG